jgi:hypothetical protein
VKRFIGWVILGVRLHRSLRAARAAIGQVGRGPIRVRSCFNYTVRDMETGRQWKPKSEKELTSLMYRLAAGLQSPSRAIQ